MSWRAFWKWIDEDFNDVRPWSLGIVGVAIGLVLMVVFSLTDDLEVRTWSQVIGAGSLLLIILPYYLYRSMKNLFRITKQSIDTISGTRTDGRNDG